MDVADVAFLVRVCCDIHATYCTVPGLENWFEKPRFWGF